MSQYSQKGGKRVARWLAAFLAILLSLSLVIGIVMIFFYS
jgi:cell division septal protein FtsQ